MNICIFSPIYPNKGSALGKFVHEQAKELAIKNNVFLITIGNKNDKEYEILDKINIYRIKGFKVLLLFKICKNFIELNKKHRFDIFHSHFVGFYTFIFGITSKLLNIPYVVTAHGIGLISKNTFSFFLRKIYLFFPNRIICVSRYVASMAGEYTNREKIIFIPNGVDIEKLRPNKSKNRFKKELNIKNEKILLSVCNLIERKGLDIIIKSLPTIIKSLPDIVYIIIGRGPEKENLVALTKQSNLSEKIRFVDYVSDKDLANFYNICDIFLLMSKTIKEKYGIEGFGVVYIEASFMGKPIIGGRSGGTSDAVVDGKTGYLINPNNIKELERKLILLLKNKKLRDKLGKNGKKRVLKGFLWKHNVKKLVKIYDEIKLNSD